MTVQSDIFHVSPIGDVIEHDTDGGDCPCGPTTEAVQRDDGNQPMHVMTGLFRYASEKALWGGDEDDEE